MSEGQQNLSVRLVRTVSFSSGHRYAATGATDEENRRLYGTWYRDKGFGHNFTLEAHLTGPVDPRSGMLIDLAQLDRWLKEVAFPLDHHYLNEDVAFFRAHPPTAENIARYCYEELKKRLVGSSAQLFKVRLHEGPDLYVDYAEAPLPAD